MHDDRMGNLLGAVALAVTDLMLADVAEISGAGPTAASALVVLNASPGLSGTELGRRVGSSQPAAARMVDALVSRQLVERHPGQGREVAVRLTRRGRRVAADILATRTGRLRQTLAVLDPTERATLSELLDKLLTGLYAEVGNADLLCRLCDRGCCATDASCPVGQADRERTG